MAYAVQFVTVEMQLLEFGQVTQNRYVADSVAVEKQAGKVRERF